MCIANKLLTRFEELSKEVENEHERLRKLNSVYDKKLNDHYHKMETAKFNAAEGFYLAKELQEIVRQRRMIKHEVYKLGTLKATIDMKIIVEKTKNARKSLNKIHNKQANSEWFKEWKDDYRVEDLQVH